jgi:hypothetical protein
MRYHDTAHALQPVASGFALKDMPVDQLNCGQKNFSAVTDPRLAAFPD